VRFLTSQTLKVPGATLHYEVRGSGPILLLIPGGNGDAGPYAPLAGLMADRFTVVAYDRRGFSRSRLDDPTDVPEDRLGVDVADAIVLLDEVGRDIDDDRAAYVFGSSSGAIVGLEILGRHPTRIQTLVAHEPPLISLLPDGDEVFSFFDEVYETSKRDGVDAAMAQFSARVGLDSEFPDTEGMPPEVADMIHRMHANNAFFLEHELRQYTKIVPDYARLQPESAKIMLVGGVESRDFLPYRPNVVLGERLARDVIDLPGDHVGYVTAPVDFAHALAGLLPDEGPGSPE
jgi:pimeloyl-ACP methyl ester carboxylesterase